MNLLVIRLSAMGDVALTVPVLKAFTRQYPDVSVTVVTRKLFEPFFASCPAIKLVFPDFKKDHKGLKGLILLFSELKTGCDYDYVIDIHDVLRTKILRFLFRLNGTGVFVINKGRKEKRRLIRGKSRKPLKHSIENYCDTFAKAGFPVIADTSFPIIDSVSDISEIIKIENKTNLPNIGVAPFAKHVLKMWPEEYMITLLNRIIEDKNVKIWLFGGYDEKDKLTAISRKVPGSFVVAGKFHIDEELALMKKLDFMIAMDSSNMHLAALVGTRVVSIWGGTDPLAGFGAWQQPDDCFVRIPVDELRCRPCTVYGRGTCRKGTMECMRKLTPEMVYDKIKKAGLI